MNNFQPPIQIKGLREMQELEYIAGFKFKRDFRGNYKFFFQLTKQEIDGESVLTDFSRYNIRIEYTKRIAPKIFIEKPEIIKRKHQYSDGSLCLYHWSNFSWGDDKSISGDLLPWIYMWIYYYETWLKTGKWFGEEYQH